MAMENGLCKLTYFTYSLSYPKSRDANASIYKVVDHGALKIIGKKHYFCLFS